MCMCVRASVRACVNVCEHVLLLLYYSVVVCSMA